MTNDPTSPDASSGGPAHWSTDPVELDRTLEGRLPGDVLAARRAEIAADAGLRRRCERREEFLSALRSAGEARRRELPARMPPGLEARVRHALRTAPARASGWLRWATAAAAVLAIAIGASFFFDSGSDVEAMPLEVVKAAAAARSSADGPRTCTDERSTSPKHFPPVREGALRIWRCVGDGERTVAKLYRPEDLPSIGYAAVAEEGARRGPNIGMTDLGDMIVFDVAYGSQRHYLAVLSDWYEREERVKPGRASCVACHNRSRDGKPNPHNIVKRSWKLR